MNCSDMHYRDLQMIRTLHHPARLPPQAVYCVLCVQATVAIVSLQSITLRKLKNIRMTFVIDMTRDKSDL